MEEGSAGMIVRAEFRGGVKPSYFAEEGVRFFVGGKWVEARIVDVRGRESGRVMDVRLSCAEAVPAGSLGMWNLPDAWVRGTSFLARVCDDLAGCAAIVCMMEELVNRQVEGHVIGMFDRAEEVGFAGVIAACEKGWVPKGSRVVGLETSKAMVGGTAGQGAIVRVGDRSSLFSSSLTHFLMQSAGFIADEDASFQFQRALMSGGMCNSTAFLTWGYDTAAMCLALHGYHNMAEHEQKIISESIELPDFHGMVRILVEAVKRYPKYEAGVGPMKSRLMAMHQAEHLPMLYDTVPRLMGS
jgi:putative aminopeptidase FrvX